MKPLIGITAGTLRDYSRPNSPIKNGQSLQYAEAVRRAGGIPLIIPTARTHSETLDIVSSFNGIIFSGGNDIHPSQYVQQVNGAFDMDEIRDEHELRLMDAVYTAKIPILAICRGLQLLNVYRGGTLFQDILTDVPNAINHDGYKDVSNEGLLLHDIEIKSGSKLARIIGKKTIQVNSLHHQAIDQLGTGLSVTARALDGIIEAIEDTDADLYVIGVQSHPESIENSIVPRWRRLFRSFIDESS